MASTEVVFAGVFHKRPDYRTSKAIVEYLTKNDGA